MSLTLDEGRVCGVRPDVSPLNNPFFSAPKQTKVPDLQADVPGSSLPSGQSQKSSWTHDNGMVIAPSPAYTSGAYHSACKLKFCHRSTVRFLRHTVLPIQRIQGTLEAYPLGHHIGSFACHGECVPRKPFWSDSTPAQDHETVQGHRV